MEDEAMKLTIKLEDIIGFTKAPDDCHYLNLKGFRQVLVSAAQWLKLKDEKAVANA
jgi:hypothetical protein